MQVRNIQGMKKIKCFFKLGFCFARESYDHIHTDGAMRQKGLDQLHSFSIQFPFIPSAHQSQYLIAAALQGDMKMRHELIAVGYKFNDLVGQKVGLNRGYAITLYSFYFIQFLYQHKEIFSLLFREPAQAFSAIRRRGLEGASKITQIHPRQYDLLYTLHSQIFHILHHINYAVTPAFSSCHRDSTE